MDCGKDLSGLLCGFQWIAMRIPVDCGTPAYHPRHRESPARRGKPTAHAAARRNKKAAFFSFLHSIAVTLRPYLKSTNQMGGYLVSDKRKVTTLRFMEMKQRGEKISMLTSYDFTTAGIVDAAGVDGILVGDSASNVMAGNATTLPATVEQMIYHARSVARAVKRALVVCDMPFGSYQVDRREGVENAIRIMKESGCDALKLEGGAEIMDTIRGILDAGIPVMGHLGLTPQSINKFGTYSVRAKEKAEADKLLSDAMMLDQAGCFGIVLEKVPAELATAVTQAVKSPTIGIGAGGHTDGQILVVDDMLGKTNGFSPRFLRRYANLNAIMADAIGKYVSDVKSNDFPNEKESY